MGQGGLPSRHLRLQQQTKTKWRRPREHLQNRYVSLQVQCQGGTATDVASTLIVQPSKITRACAGKEDNKLCCIVY